MALVISTYYTNFPPMFQAWTVIYSIFHLKQTLWKRPSFYSIFSTVEGLIVLGLSLLIFSSSLVPYVQRIDSSMVDSIPPLAHEAYRNYGSKYHLTSSYGLFARMTTERDEVIIEGSKDGKTWIPYEFKYKPGDVNRAPPIVGKCLRAYPSHFVLAPHQPRLDWQVFRPI